MVNAPQPRRVMLCAGEPSGDAIGAQLLRAVVGQVGPVEWTGLGGEHLVAAGLASVADHRRLAVMGFTEIIGALPAAARALWRLRRLMTDERPDVVVLIDYPGFNLIVARVAHHLGIPVVYLVAPKVWAWGRWRLRSMQKTLSHLLALFPFEKAFFEGAGIPTTFIGHPLADRPCPPARNEGPIALLPGSRAQEIKRLMPVMLEAAAAFQSRHSDAHFVLPVASPSLLPAIHSHIRRGKPIPLELRMGGAWSVLAEARVAVVASGTATLEAAAAQCPSVVIYAVSSLSHAIGRRLVRGVSHIALPNILAGRGVMPEHIQTLDPAVIAHELSALAQDGLRRRQALADLGEVRRSLGPGGAIERAASQVTHIAGWGGTPRRALGHHRQAMRPTAVGGGGA